MTRFRLYVLSKLAWFLVAFFIALIFNFLLPRLIPGNPVDTMVARMASGGNMGGQALQQIYQAYINQFGLNKPLYVQFFIYIGNLLHGDMGVSFSQSPPACRT